MGRRLWNILEWILHGTPWSVVSGAPMSPAAQVRWGHRSKITGKGARGDFRTGSIWRAGLHSDLNSGGILERFWGMSRM